MFFVECFKYKIKGIKLKIKKRIPVKISADNKLILSVYQPKNGLRIEKITRITKFLTDSIVTLTFDSVNLFK